MNDIKLICVDLDGTLLGSDHLPTCENVKALRVAEKAGIAVCVATGRTPPVCLPIAGDISPNAYLIALNGAVTCSPGEPFKINSPIPDNTIFELMDTLSEFKYFHIVLSDGSIVSEDRTAEKRHLKRYMEAYSTFPEFEYIAVGDLKAYILSKKGNRKIVGFATKDTRENAAAARKLLSLRDDVTVCSSWVDNVEINGKGVSKGSAMLELCRKLSVSPENCMAVGDSLNDASMLKAAGFSVAMENAEPELIGYAKFVTASNDCDGVAKAVYRLTGIGSRALR